jgi:FKBP-type peptidyl-prolyl cis-trans isomerase FkpA
MNQCVAAAAFILAALASAACAADATEEKTASGILITTIQAGSGSSPKAADVVKVHYRGTLTDGKEFDSSIKRGRAATFPLNRVIPCWTEGVQTMKVGGKAKLVCPPNLAYGSRGVPGTIPPDSTLVFEIELLEIVK